MLDCFVDALVAIHHHVAYVAYFNQNVIKWKMSVTLSDSTQN